MFCYDVYTILLLAMDMKLKYLGLRTIYVQVLSLFLSSFSIHSSAQSTDNNYIFPKNSNKHRVTKNLKNKINLQYSNADAYPYKILPDDKNKLIKDWDNYGNLVYKLLSDEFITQRSNPINTFDSYIYLANHLKDPKIAERATQIAIDAGDFNKAEQAALIWKNYIKDENKFNLYRTLCYLSVQLKDYSKLSEYIKLWLDSIPKNNNKEDKFAGELNNLPNIINITDPVAANDAADKILVYKTLEAKLAAAKLLIKAKQNKGVELITSLKNEYPNHEDIFFTWLSSLALPEQIEELKVYIEKAKQYNAESELKRKSAQDLLLEQNENTKDSNSIKSGNIQKNTNTDAPEDDKQEFNLKRAQFALLGVLFTSGDLKTGIETANKIVIEYPQDLEYSFLLAQMYRVQKDYKSAYSVMNNLLENNKKLPLSMYLFLADISKEMKEYKLAAYWMEQTGTNEIAVIREIAGLYLQANEYEKAYKYYNQIRNKLSDADKIQKFDMLSLQLWLASKQWNYALEIISRLISENPKSADLYSIRSDIYLFTENFEKAELDLNAIINLDKDNMGALNSLAYIYAEKSIKLDLALEYIKKAVEKDSENYAYQDTMGWVLYKQGKVEQAKKWLEQSWNTQPDAETGIHLGEVLWALGERDQSKIIWELARKINSNNKIQEELKNNLNRK